MRISKNIDFFDGKIKGNLVENLLLTKIKYNNTVIDLGIK